jgi:kynurenine aminotransferase
VAADRSSEVFTDANANIMEYWLRFAVCRTDDRLELAKEG